MRALRQAQLRQAQAAVSRPGAGPQGAWASPGRAPGAAPGSDDGGMFWEYGREGSALPTPPVSASKSGWAAAAAAAAASAPEPVRSAQPSRPQAPAKPQQGFAAVASGRPVASAPAPAPAPAKPAQGSGKKGSVKARQEEFRSWCESQIKPLTGSNDMTLLDFLLSLPSAGEVRDYVALYLGESEAATAFGAEFLRRKRADPALSSVGGTFGGGGEEEAWTSASRK